MFAFRDYIRTVHDCSVHLNAEEWHTHLDSAVAKILSYHKAQCTAKRIIRNLSTNSDLSAVSYDYELQFSILYLNKQKMNEWFGAKKKLTKIDTKQKGYNFVLFGM